MKLGLPKTIQIVLVNYFVDKFITRASVQLQKMGITNPYKWATHYGTLNFEAEIQKKKNLTAELEKSSYSISFTLHHFKYVDYLLPISYLNDIFNIIIKMSHSELYMNK